MRRTWLAACVAIVPLVGCQPPEGGKKGGQRTFFAAG